MTFAKFLIRISLLFIIKLIKARFMSPIFSLVPKKFLVRSRVGPLFKIFNSIGLGLGFGTTNRIFVGIGQSRALPIVTLVRTDFRLKLFHFWKKNYFMSRRLIRSLYNQFHFIRFWGESNEKKFQANGLKFLMAMKEKVPAKFLL